MIPYLDNSGPTFAINVQQSTAEGQESVAYKLLLSMLDGTVTNPLPRLDAASLEDKGVFHCKCIYLIFLCTITNIHNHLHQIHVRFSALTRIPIRSHVSDRLLLNKNQESTMYMLTLLQLICTDRYSSIFALNRCLYSKFTFI